MQATVAFFWAMIATGWPLAIRRFGAAVAAAGVDPGLLFRRVAEKADTAAERNDWDLGCGGSGEGPFPGWSLGHVGPDLEADLESKARQCADFSSGAVLAWKDATANCHGITASTSRPKECEALTVLHNYACSVKTAARRPSDFTGRVARPLRMALGAPHAVRPGPGCPPICLRSKPPKKSLQRCHGLPLALPGHRDADNPITSIASPRPPGNDSRAGTGKVTMGQGLRITIHDNLESLTFQLEGKLAGPWVGEVEKCRQCAAWPAAELLSSSTLPGATFIDDAGKARLGGHALPWRRVPCRRLADEGRRGRACQGSGSRLRASEGRRRKPDLTELRHS